MADGFNMLDPIKATIVTPGLNLDGKFDKTGIPASDLTKFLTEHPGGELAISTFADRDASEEFNMIRPPDVIPKDAPGGIIGVLGVASSAPRSLRVASMQS
jgi:hypothetical protein